MKNNTKPSRGKANLMKHLFTYFMLFIHLNIVYNPQLQGMDKKIATHVQSPIPAISILEKINNNPINHKDEGGNTVAHFLAPTAIEDRALLVTIFNEFIKKGLDPQIRNLEGKTARQVALDKYSCHRNYCYASNGNLFHRLEMGFSPNDTFVLESDNMTISFKHDQSSAL